MIIITHEKLKFLKFSYQKIDSDYDFGYFLYGICIYIFKIVTSPQI